MTIPLEKYMMNSYRNLLLYCSNRLIEIFCNLHNFSYSFIIFAYAFTKIMIKVVK